MTVPLDLLNPDKLLPVLAENQFLYNKRISQPVFGSIIYYHYRPSPIRGYGTYNSITALLGRRRKGPNHFLCLDFFGRKLGLATNGYVLAVNIAKSKFKTATIQKAREILFNKDFKMSDLNEICTILGGKLYYVTEYDSLTLFKVSTKTYTLYNGHSDYMLEFDPEIHY